MAGATNPGNVGHAWVKALWVTREPAPGMESPEEYCASDYEFVQARLEDNPVYANDENYKRTLAALPGDLKRAFLDGNWDVFAGQYFDRFDVSRNVRRVEEIAWQSWWPRWISVDWGFEHPAATYWHTRTIGEGGADGCGRVATYREYVTHRTAPRELARAMKSFSLLKNAGSHWVRSNFAPPLA